MIVRVCTLNSHSSDRPTSKPSATKKFTPGFPVFGLVRMVNFRWHCKIPFPHVHISSMVFSNTQKIASNNVIFDQEKKASISNASQPTSPQKGSNPPNHFASFKKPRDAKRLGQKAHAVAWSTARVRDDSVGR